MHSKINHLIKTLQNRYNSSSSADTIFSASGKEYKLHKEKSFNEYSPFDAEKHFKVAAADAGSLLIYETPGWSVGYYKISFRLFEVNLKGKTCNTVQKEKKTVEDFVLILNHEAEGTLQRRPNEDAEAALNRFRAEKEREFIDANINKLGEEDLLLIDGSLDNENLTLLSKHKNIVGVSKSSQLSILGFSALSYFTREATERGLDEKSWFTYPLIKTYPTENHPELIFGTFKPKSVAFRIDFPPNSSKDFILKNLQKLAVCSLDSKYKAYPYPLGAVHSDAVMRKNTKRLMRQFIKKELSKSRDEAPIICELIKEDMLHADWYDKLREMS